MLDTFKAVLFVSAFLIPVTLKTAIAGDLEPTTGPADDGSAMYTVEDIFQRLDNGSAGTKSSGGFPEPVSGPTSGTMHTLNEIMDAAPSADNSGGAQDSAVLLGKSYWGLTEDQWGERTGTMPNVGTMNVTPTTSDITISPGYHNGSGKVAGDADLTTGNIRAGVNIFGVTGNSDVVNTSSGDAGSSDIAFGKKAWVDGAEVTGYLAGGTPCDPAASYSANGRWCNNGDGTITDVTTGLLWYHKGNNFWGTFLRDSLVHLQNTPVVPSNISNMRHRNPSDLTDGSSMYDWRLPTVNELLHVTSGVDSLVPGNVHGFSGIQTGWYWSSTISTNPSTFKVWRVQMPKPYPNAVGVEEFTNALYWGMAVRNPK